MAKDKEERMKSILMESLKLEEMKKEKMLNSMKKADHR
jgi:hypothetical protein